MITKRTAAVIPHFQVDDDNLTARKFNFFVSLVFFEPHRPLKNFKYAQRAIIIGRIDQGAGIVESIRLHIAMPIALTVKPANIVRRINGTLFHAIAICFEIVPCFILK